MRIVATFSLAFCAALLAASWSFGETAKRAGEDWWSLQPIQRPETAGTGNPIDGFVRSELKAKGLSPSAPAEKRDLLRRIYFDLTGLPPSPAEMQAFIEDADPQAYERRVDALLASPHYGERWARHWLDAVRFGESHGFEYNQPRNNFWPYRNWVIQALNDNMPYDQFVQWQLAGDHFGEGKPEGFIATGFLVTGPHNTTLPSNDPMRKTMRQDEMEGLIATVGQTFMGLTVNCARCHDHKFDPISITDYYRMAAALNGVKHGERKVDPIEDVTRKQEADALKLEHRKLRNQLRDMLKPARAQLLEARKNEPEEAPPPPQAYAAWDFTQGLDDLEGGFTVSLKDGARQDEHGLHLDGAKAWAATGPITTDLKAKTLEAWVKLGDLNQKGGGAISVQTLNGHTFDAIVFAEREPKRWMAGSDSFKRYDSFKAPEEKEALGRPVQIAIVFQEDGTITGYREGLPYGQPYKKALQPYSANQAQVVFGIRHGTAPAAGRMLKGLITKARLYDRALTPDEVAASAGTASDYISDKDAIASLSPEQKAERAAKEKRFAELDGKIKRLESQNKPMTVYANLSQRPPETHVLTRGNVMTPAEKVTPGGLGALKTLNTEFGLEPNAGDRERRVKLADWITHPDNPLFARVAVNRLWHHHFGAGIVTTPNDFGYSGGKPSHPELLDWLASAFQASGYDLKAMHRLIVTSATYRQSAAENPKAMAIDTDNRYLWRMSPRRLEAEELRDSVLTLAGKLNREIGGLGYRDMREYKFKGSHFYDPIPQDKPEQFRRTLYRFSPRGAKRTMLDTFDCPDPSTITPARAMTTTPLQSLSLMNNDFILLMADAFAARLEDEAKTTEARVQRAFDLAYGRPADKRETALMTPFIEEHELAAFGRVIFNSNEFMHVR